MTHPRMANESRPFQPRECFRLSRGFSMRFGPESEIHLPSRGEVIMKGEVVKLISPTGLPVDCRGHASFTNRF